METITPIAVNASWFAALKGRVWKTEVTKLSATSDHLCLEPDWGRSGSFPAPTDAKRHDVYWVALCDAAPDVKGIGRSPADAIADFNTNMVVP